MANHGYKQRQTVPSVCSDLALRVMAELRELEAMTLSEQQTTQMIAADLDVITIVIND